MEIPRDRDHVVLEVEGRAVRLTNLHKVFWPALGLTKGDLLQYDADMAPVPLPHVRDRAMVMRGYPDGAAGEDFFMKRAPSPRPAPGRGGRTPGAAAARQARSLRLRAPGPSRRPTWAA